MPPVFTFVRENKEILEELLHVFNLSKGNAREHWSLQAELVMEPVGWDALWKLSKDYCKKFDVRYPCIAYISVTSVDYENLSACIDVLSVQHESMTLPEQVEDVPLIELWPTEEQREVCVDAQGTANFIDLLRFFYNNIWMPWDDQDNKELLPNTIEERMDLWTDLHNGIIPNGMARQITLLRKNAIGAHEKLKELDSSLCEGVLSDEDDSLLPPSYLSTCAEINAKLDSLMSQWTLYENPIIREQFVNKMKAKMQKNENKKHAVVLWEGGSVHIFEEVWHWVRTVVNNDDDVSLTITHNVDDALTLGPRVMMICSKHYELPEIPLANINICSFSGTTLRATEMRSCLLNLSDECNIRDVTLQCTLVNTVVVMRNGRLHMENCIFTDDSKNCQKDFAQGIVAMPGSKILIKDCILDNFYSGIVVHKGAQIEIWNCVIKRCGVGVQMCSGSEVSLYNNTKIEDCKEQSIRCDVESEDKNIVDENGIQGLTVDHTCKLGTGDLKKEVLIIQQDVNIN